MKSIFGEEAPKYWAKGLSVTPLRGKAAFLDDWSKYHDCLPSKETQNDWVMRYSGFNIGILTGKQSGVVLIDVDTLDPVLQEAIKSVLPPTPWIRIGKKGFAAAYRYGGERSAKIRDANGNNILEIFSSRTQMVLPPSIHPETLQPYVSNSHLYEVMDQLVGLGDGFEEKIRFELGKHVPMEKKGAGKDFRAINFVSAGSRDIKMTQYAGLLAHEVLKGNASLRKALDMMIAWGENQVEAIAGDPVDINKGCNHIVSFLMRDVHTKNRILPTGWDADLTAEEKANWNLALSVDQEQWTFERILKHLETEFVAHEGPNSPGKLAAIEFILKKIAQSKNLSVLEVDRLLVFIVKNSGSSIAITSYRKRIKELTAGPIAGVNHTEIAQAAIKEFEEKVGLIRYHDEDFYTWAGSHWIEVTDSTIERIVSMEYGHLDAAKRYSDISGIRKSMKNLVQHGIKRLPVEGVNFANGFLTTELQLLPHNPDFGMIYTMPFRYVPDAPAPVRFLEFLESIWGHRKDKHEQIQMLREAMAVTIFGIAPRYQKAILMYGPGGTGKSQILDIVSFLVPDEARSAVAPETWEQTFSTSSLHGKLLNVCGELHEDRYLTGKNFKEIIDGSEITAQFKNAPLFKFRATAAHWFSSNHLPKSRDTSLGFNRRWLFLEFDKIIKVKEKVVDLGKIIAQAEVEQIAAWAIGIMPHLIRQKEYTESQSSRKLIDMMGQQNSNIRQFIRGCVFRKENSKVMEEELYKMYWGFVMGKSRGKAINDKKFFIEFRQIIAEQDCFSAIIEGGKDGYMHMGVKA